MTFDQAIAKLTHYNQRKALLDAGYKPKPCEICKGTGTNDAGTIVCFKCEGHGETWAEPEKGME